VRFRSAVATVAIATVATALTGAGAASTSTTTLRLDGTPFRPELALTSERRNRGLMRRSPAPADGMLFVFPSNTTGGFWMKDTLVPLRILFFDAAGARVRKLSMTPCKRDPCRVYEPGRRYRFALELPASDTRPGRILGPTRELRRLARRAS
jgi:uncharacterized membrane protein (UPF0127 family)